jgi:hypothetical protein
MSLNEEGEKFVIDDSSHLNSLELGVKQPSKLMRVPGSIFCRENESKQAVAGARDGRSTFPTKAKLSAPVGLKLLTLFPRSRLQVALRRFHRTLFL